MLSPMVSTAPGFDVVIFNEKLKKKVLCVHELYVSVQAHSMCPEGVGSLLTPLCGFSDGTQGVRQL